LECFSVLESSQLLEFGLQHQRPRDAALVLKYKRSAEVGLSGVIDGAVSVAWLLDAMGISMMLDSARIDSNVDAAAGGSPRVNASFSIELWADWAMEKDSCSASGTSCLLNLEPPVCHRRGRGTQWPGSGSIPSQTA
jgi:hypothetical protein